jgi:alpha-beta hydrolase superfamily lysophospholipase
MAEPQDVTLEMSDGYSIRSRWWPGSADGVSVVYLHGIQSHGEWFLGTASRLAASGAAVLLPDRRGSGLNREARGHAPSAGRLIDDVGEQLDWVRERSGRSGAHLVGVSWGGKLAFCVQQRAAERVEGLTLISPGIFARVDLSWGLKCRVAAARVFSPRRGFPIPLDDPKLFTTNPEWIEFIRNDPHRLENATASFFFASRSLGKVAQTTSCGPSTPLHLFLAEHDRIIDNERTKAWARGLGWPNRSITEYEGTHHTLEFESTRERFIGDLVTAVTGRGA